MDALTSALSQGLPKAVPVPPDMAQMTEKFQKAIMDNDKEALATGSSKITDYSCWAVLVSIIHSILDNGRSYHENWSRRSLKPRCSLVPFPHSVSVERFL